MRFLFLFFLLLGIAPGLQSQSQSGTDYAFIFYNTTFTQGWTALTDTEEEAIRLKNELESNYNFRVELIPNLSLANLKDRLREINSRPFGNQDQVLFYFSSHGYYKADSENGYLIPADGPHRWEYGDGWLSYGKLREYLATNSARHVLLALDACYSGSFGVKYKGAPTETPWENGADCQTVMRNSLQKKSRLFFTSGNKSERTPANSIFLNRWLQCLRERPQRGYYTVTNTDLHTYVNTISGFSPEAGEFSNHEAGGGFVFVHKDACKSSPAPVTRLPAADGDTQAWLTATQRNTPAAYSGYLALYPNGEYAATARSLIGTPAPVAAANTRIPRSSSSPPPDNMVLVSGGTFSMGDQFGEGEDNETQHEVTISSFYMGRTEVTFAEYDTYCTATGKDAPDDAGWGRDSRPVINVSWYDAVAYCNWKSEMEQFTPVYTISGENVTANWQANGYRLPTEAEWEYAARSEGKKHRFGNGQAIIRPSEANFDARSDYKEQFSEVGTYRQKTMPVGSFQTNDIGLADMSGNVLEWCWDWYASYATRSPPNPKGAVSGSNRVPRGGSWGFESKSCRASSRFGRYADHRSKYCGFRLARSY